MIKNIEGATIKVKIYQQYGVLEDKQDHINVGLMFFNNEPQRFFPYSQIEVVDLRNGPEGDDMTEQIFKGPIDSMIKSTLIYIKNTVIVEKILKIEEDLIIKN